MRDCIYEIWSGVIKEKAQADSQKQCQYDIHDLGFAISQLVEPTIAIIVQCATLYICIKNGQKKNGMTIKSKRINVSLKRFLKTIILNVRILMK